MERGGVRDSGWLREGGRENGYGKGLKQGRFFGGRRG